mmetsp:Transcript_5806/g.9163  ORF Transcript_5806/g.9163 Transcript_5806/m.9163 type:complete len:506 (+) Transcript_5806:33-1550(+)
MMLSHCSSFILTIASLVCSSSLALMQLKSRSVTVLRSHPTTRLSLSNDTTNPKNDENVLISNSNIFLQLLHSKQHNPATALANLLADDFVFVSTDHDDVMTKDQYLHYQTNVWQTFVLPSFDSQTTIYGHVIDPYHYKPETTKLWCLSRQRLMQVKEFLDQPHTHKVIRVPPQVHSFEFDAFGKIRHYGCYTTANDKSVIGTGGIYGILQAMKAPPGLIRSTMRRLWSKVGARRRNNRNMNHMNTSQDASMTRESPPMRAAQRVLPMNNNGESSLKTHESPNPPKPSIEWKPKKYVTPNTKKSSDSEGFDGLSTKFKTKAASTTEKYAGFSYQSGSSKGKTAAGRPSISNKKQLPQLKVVYGQIQQNRRQEQHKRNIVGDSYTNNDKSVSSSTRQLTSKIYGNVSPNNNDDDNNTNNNQGWGAAVMNKYHNKKQNAKKPWIHVAATTESDDGRFPKKQQPPETRTVPWMENSTPVQDNAPRRLRNIEETKAQKKNANKRQWIVEQ